MADLRFRNFARWAAVLGSWSICIAAFAERPQFEIGVTTHLASDESLAMIERAGIDSIRDDIRWEIIEKEKDHLEMHPRYEQYVGEAVRRGLHPMLILDYGNPNYDGAGFPRSAEALAGYVRFCEFVVKHFRGRVFRYEVWNEWNAGTDIGMPGVAEDYVALLAAAHRAIKRIGPEVTVIGGVMSGNGLRNGWLEAACNAGMLDHMDVLSFHPYCWGAPDERERLPELGLERRVRDLEEFIAHYPHGATMPLAVSEVGWPTHHGVTGVTDEVAAAYFTRAALLLAARPRMRGMWWYEWSDDGEDETQSIMRFGLVTSKLVLKDAYAAAEKVAAFLKPARGPLRWHETENTRSVSFRDARGREHVAAWTLAGRETVRLFAVHSTAGRRMIQTTPHQPPLNRSWEKRGARSMLRVTVGTDPTFITPRD